MEGKVGERQIEILIRESELLSRHISSSHRPTFVSSYSSHTLCKLLVDVGGLDVDVWRVQSHNGFGNSARPTGVIVDDIADSERGDYFERKVDGPLAHVSLELIQLLSLVLDDLLGLECHVQHINTEKRW